MLKVDTLSTAAQRNCRYPIGHIITSYYCSVVTSSLFFGEGAGDLSCALILININLHTKFEMPCFTHYIDMIGARAFYAQLGVTRLNFAKICGIRKLCTVVCMILC